jgi:hypothetical protein
VEKMHNGIRAHDSTALISASAIEGAVNCLAPGVSSRGALEVFRAALCPSHSQLRDV